MTDELRARIEAVRARAERRYHSSPRHLDYCSSCQRDGRTIRDCDADLALLDGWCGTKIAPTVESLSLEGFQRAVLANLTARYPERSTSNDH